MEITQHWRLKPQRYQLIGKVCSKCGPKTFPPRDVCLTCIDNNLEIGVRFYNQRLILTIPQSETLL